MSCEICGRGSCARYMHSIEDQERFDAAKKFDGDVRAIMDVLDSKDSEVAALRAEMDALREELEAERGEAEDAIRRLCSLSATKPITGEAVQCSVCGQRKSPIGRDAPAVLHLCDHECSGYYSDPAPGGLWPGETLADFGYPQDRAEADRALREVLSLPAIRRACERVGGKP